MTFHSEETEVQRGKDLPTVTQLYQVGTRDEHPGLWGYRGPSSLQVSHLLLPDLKAPLSPHLHVRMAFFFFFGWLLSILFSQLSFTYQIS